ncbi:MAG: CYTH domain-containing protein [Candidatus Sungbacteria bacterium]|nr:CYTH domain-containing protein [Candidatus Sungbacteria bacterium]
MDIELEAKWLDIDAGAVRKKLKSLGADRVYSERLMRRRVFDFADKRLYARRGWVRVRDEGDKVTLSYKELTDRTIRGTKEIKVVVNDFEEMCSFLKAVGLEEKSYQETKRELWKLEESEITIDTWPWIPTFIEIEAPSEHLLRAAAEKLDLDWPGALPGSVEIAYQRYYDVTEEEIDHWSEILFSPMPEWLEAKRKL